MPIDLEHTDMHDTYAYDVIHMIYQHTCLYAYRLRHDEKVMYIYIYIYIRIYIYTHTHAHTHTHKHTHTHTHIHTHTHTHTHTSTHTNTQSHIHTHNHDVYTPQTWHTRWRRAGDPWACRSRQAYGYVCWYITCMTSSAYVSYISVSSKSTCIRTCMMHMSVWLRRESDVWVPSNIWVRIWVMSRTHLHVSQSHRTHAVPTSKLSMRHDANSPYDRMLEIQSGVRRCMCNVCIC